MCKNPKRAGFLPLRRLYMFYYSFFDWTLFLLLPALVFSLIAQYRVKRAFEWGSRTKTSHGLTGAQAARKILDENGLLKCKIFATNSLDEYLITDLERQGACIDSYGVGDAIATSKAAPCFGNVYKLTLFTLSLYVLCKYYFHIVIPFVIKNRNYALALFSSM